MKFKLFGKYKSFINSLATVEQKSFWIVGPVIVISGVLSITTSTAYSSYFAWAAIGLCISIPSIVMIACFKTKNYSVCYPMLCIGTAGVCLPITFLANGGFNSGMPIFCTAATILCTFCYEKKWRIISFISSYGLSLGVFFWARQGFEIIAPLDKNWVENDIIFSYAIVSVALFFCVDFILNEIHVYASGNEVLENYMDSKVRNELIVQASKGNLSVNGQARRVTVFFADINRFTTITERISPVQTAEFLNMYLSVAEKAIHKNDGILDKFIGDCVMAYWIDIDKNGKGVLSAVKTAFDMKKELREKAPEIFEKYGNELEFSTGIEYGDVILGSIGSSGRKEYTIIGDAVNTASRIQGQAKNGEVLISNNVYKVLKNKLEVSKAKDAIYLKGKNTPTIIYEVEGVVEGSVDGKVEKNIQLNNNEYTFYICGCRGKYPVSGMRFSQFGGETSCYILKKDKYAMVIDCGTGLVKSKDILKDCEKIDVLLTHVHYDHILGLLNKDVFPSNVKLRMFGHFGSWIGDKTIPTFFDTPFWHESMENVEYVDVTLNTDYEFDKNIKASFHRADHPDNGCVIKIMAKDKKICIFSDLENPQYISDDVARYADILIYDGMYDKEDKLNHKGDGHSTWQDGIEYARAHEVNRLIITHHSPDKTDQELTALENKAKAELLGTVFARSGEKYNF